MLCEKCKKNQANIIYTHLVNGVLSKTALCNDCAKDELPFNSEINLFSKTFNKKSADVCTLCGSTLNDIIHTGKIGCAKCYEVFQNELDQIIKSIHGNVTHTGRTPGEIGKINSLKKQLKEAVSLQEFEKAAVLRDEINRLEADNNG